MATPQPGDYARDWLTRHALGASDHQATHNRLGRVSSAASPAITLEHAAGHTHAVRFLAQHGNHDAQQALDRLTRAYRDIAQQAGDH